MKKCLLRTQRFQAKGFLSTWKNSIGKLHLKNNIEIYTWKATGNLSWGSRHKKHVYVESLKFSIFIPFSQAKRICIKYSIAHKVATAKFHFSYVFSLNECMNFCSICLLKLIKQNKKNNARSPSLVKIKGNKENVDFIEIFFFLRCWVEHVY